jgi:hypothetical protein
VSTALLIIGLVLVVTIGGALAAWSLARNMAGARPRSESAPEAIPPPAFCWRNLAIPITLLALSVILAGIFYRLLPAEVGYHFESDGAPDAWVSRSAIILWATVPQFFLTVLGAVLAYGVGRLAIHYRIAESTGVRLDGVIRLVGGMVAVPQAVLFVAMLDIFSYNSNQVHILPLWILILVVLTVGSLILAFFFMRTVRQLWGASR